MNLARFWRLYAAAVTLLWRRLRCSLCCFICTILLLSTSLTTAQTPPVSAIGLLQTALDQLGGKARLQSLLRIRTKGLRSQNLLEQSERFEGPWLRNVLDFEEVCDFNALEQQVKVSLRGDQFPDWTKIEFAFGFRGRLQRRGNAFLQTPQESAERLWQDPLRLLLLAETTTDLRLGASATRHLVPCHTLRFTVGQTPCTVYLSAFTNLPMMIETVSSRQDFWSVWGDVTSRTEYTNWQTLPGGWHYPFSWTVTRNDLPHTHTTLTQVEIETSLERVVAVQEAFEQIQAALQSPKPRPAPVFHPVQVAEGIYQFPGGFNTNVIVQPEGLVVLEPINNSEFNEAFLSDLKERFPGKKVYAVVATDDAWPHCGGIRPYTARDIPVYTLRENRDFFQKLVAAPHRLAPDALQRKSRPLRLKGVADRLVLGSGPNRLEILPVRGAESERMAAVYFPERRLLYGSDLIQRTPDGKLYNPQITRELRDMVAREKLVVETVFAMHSAPLSWSSLLTALQASVAASNPSSKQ